MVEISFIPFFLEFGASEYYSTVELDQVLYHTKV